MADLLVIHELGRRGMNVQGKQALLEKHYLHRLPPVSHSFIAFLNDRFVGVVTFGVPPSRHLQMSACPSDPSRVLELNRLWIDDNAPDQLASRLVSASLRQLPPAIIVSYADTAAGHHGGVYRACNFFYAGWTDMERKTPRFDYVPNSGKHSRDAFRGEPGAFERVRRKPKVKYWTVTGAPRERRALLRIAGWPRLNWKTLEVPL